MARIVLVHGAWWDGRIWDRVSPLLGKAGHDAGDKPVGEVSLHDYVERVCEVLDAPEDLVVGRSTLTGEDLATYVGA